MSERCAICRCDGCDGKGQRHVTSSEQRLLLIAQWQAAFEERTRLARALLDANDEVHRLRSLLKQIEDEVTGT